MNLNDITALKDTELIDMRDKLKIMIDNRDKQQFHEKFIKFRLAGTINPHTIEVEKAIKQEIANRGLI